MPPLIEEDEASGDEIPFKDPAPENGDAEEQDESGGEEDGDEEAEEYVVEKILGHDWTEDGILLFQVKWAGYEDPKDLTWEPEENLVTAKETLKAYFKKKGGRPTKPSESTTKKSKKRKLDDTDTPKTGKGSKKGKSETPEVVSGRKKKIEKGQDDWKPPTGSWENDVMDIDTIEEVLDPQEGVQKRFAYVVWINGRKTRHQLPTLNQKCPQKMLNYYESHLVFRQAEANGSAQ